MQLVYESNQYVMVLCMTCNEVLDLKFWYVLGGELDPVAPSHTLCPSCAKKMEEMYA